MLRLLLVFALSSASRVTVTSKAIVLRDPIYFEIAKAEIMKTSFAELDDVAAAIVADKHLALVEVGVHTDERGDDKWNLELSQRRADAIVAYLVGKGVDAKRLRATGYGETRPLDKHHTPAAWARNRRTELVILQRVT
jgi:OmpA-OmpF porin, OOP family